MQSSSDSSLWRSLAVAFGDGLAFGVGMKLTQAAGRQLTAPRSSAPARSDPTPLADRVEQIEHNLKRIERVERAPVAGSGAVDQKVLEAIVNALEARLAEHSGQVERRLADQDARYAIELRSLDQQDHSIAKQAADDIGALQKQMLDLHREFGEAVARIVAEQVGIPVSNRLVNRQEQTNKCRLKWFGFNAKRVSNRSYIVKFQPLQFRGQIYHDFRPVVPRSPEFAARVDLRRGAA